MSAPDSYYLALGKFVHAYSQVEAALHLTFHQFAKIECGVANTIKRQSNAGTMSGIIRNLLIENDFPAEIIFEMRSVLDRFTLIADFRDRTIHRGARLSEDGTFISDNRPTMRSIETLEVVHFDLKHLQDATADLQSIIIRILAAADPESVKDDPPEWRRFAHSPWRYKPVQPEKPHQPAKPAKPKHPPRLGAYRK
jgi:hypothetical protein